MEAARFSGFQSLCSTVLKGREIMIVLNEHKRIFFPFSIRVRDMCTCRVSAVGVRLITFQCFD